MKAVRCYMETSKIGKQCTILMCKSDYYFENCHINRLSVRRLLKYKQKFSMHLSVSLKFLSRSHLIMSSCCLATRPIFSIYAPIAPYESVISFFISWQLHLVYIAKSLIWCHHIAWQPSKELKWPVFDPLSTLNVWQKQWTSFNSTASRYWSMYF